MRFLRRKPRLTLDERLEAQEARTGYGWDIWWNSSALDWSCRIENMAGRWSATSKDHAKRILLDAYRRVPDKGDQ